MVNARATTAGLIAAVLLLLGVVVGQNLERRRAPDARPRAGAGYDGAASRPGPAAARADLPSPAPVAPEPAAPPRSANEYWITPPVLDVTRTGYSSWADLRVGGVFVLERCRAPDYRLPEQRDVPVPPPLPRCDAIVDGTISELNDAQIVVRPRGGAPRTFGYALGRADGVETLRLEIDTWVELVPGHKDALFQRLGRLPQDEGARTGYLQQMFARQQR